MNDLLELSIDSKNLRVANRECEHREFKVAFDKDSLWKYAKTMASFANRNGGILFFGVKDKPRELMGVSGILPDELVFGNFVKEYFEPEISFSLDTKEYHGKTLLYVKVEPSARKPIICKKRKVLQFKEKGKQDKELLREGAIYYRYSSSSDEIKCPELQKILEDRAHRLFTSLIENITLINKVGHDRVALVDANELSGKDRTAKVYITSETASNINWIKKGHFTDSEESGEKAFYVTKEVEISHGVEIEKPVPTDPSKTHPLTKTKLGDSIQIKSPYLDPVLIKMGLLGSPEYHYPQQHGKTVLHKFSDAAVEKILAAYPLDMKKRKEEVKAVYQKHLNQKKKRAA